MSNMVGHLTSGSDKITQYLLYFQVNMSQALPMTFLDLEHTIIRPSGGFLSCLSLPQSFAGLPLRFHSSHLLPTPISPPNVTNPTPILQ